MQTMDLPGVLYSILTAIQIKYEHSDSKVGIDQKINKTPGQVLTHLGRC